MIYRGQEWSLALKSGAVVVFWRAMCPATNKEKKVTTRSFITTLIALGMSACASHDINDFCRYSQAQTIREADPESLALVLGVQPGRTKVSPFVVFRSLSEHSPEASVTLSAAAAPHSMPMNLDESRCAGVDWSTYTLTVDRDEWKAFWLDERTAHFEVAIAFLDHSEPLMVSAFGAAILDTSASDYLVSCGCYWK